LSEVDGMLPGAAGDFEHNAGFGQDSHEDGKDGIAIACGSGCHAAGVIVIGITVAHGASPARNAARVSVRTLGVKRSRRTGIKVV
jgi:hypothetical protein